MFLAHVPTFDAHICWSLLVFVFTSSCCHVTAFFIWTLMLSFSHSLRGIKAPLHFNEKNCVVDALLYCSPFPFAFHLPAVVLCSQSVQMCCIFASSSAFPLSSVLDLSLSFICLLLSPGVWWKWRRHVHNCRTWLGGAFLATPCCLSFVLRTATKHFTPLWQRFCSSSSLFSKTSSFGRAFLYNGSTPATLSLKAPFHTSPIDINAFHITVVEEVLETCRTSYAVSYTMVLATFSVCKKCAAIMKSVGSLIVAKKASTSLAGIRKALHKANALGPNECLSDRTLLPLLQSHLSPHLASFDTPVLTPIDKHHEQSLIGKLPQRSQHLSACERSWFASGARVCILFLKPSTSHRMVLLISVLLLSVIAGCLQLFFLACHRHSTLSASYTAQRLLCTYSLPFVQSSIPLYLCKLRCASAISCTNMVFDIFFICDVAPY